MTSLLDIRQLILGYEQTIVVNNLNMQIQLGEIGCLLGASGCGKTTLLRAIAGFSSVSSGEIWLDHSCISSPNIHQVPEQRGIGMVFQDYALFPHLTVAENIAFGLQSLSKSIQQQRVTELLQLVRLPELDSRYPHELSGGQQQRVALARAIAPRPKLLLLDEPFSNLDTGLRRVLAAELKTILKQQGITAIIVTHDKQEAFAFADKIGILASGALLQWGSPEQLYKQPVNAEVANLLGAGQLFEAERVSVDMLNSELGMLSVKPEWDAPQKKAISLFLRAQDICLDKSADTVASVEREDFLGDAYAYKLLLSNGRHLELILTQALGLKVGTKIGFKLNTDEPIYFNAN